MRKIYRFNEFLDYSNNSGVRNISEQSNKISKSGLSKYQGDEILSLATILESETDKPEKLSSLKPDTSAKTDNTSVSKTDTNYQLTGMTGAEHLELQKKLAKQAIGKIAKSPGFLENFPNYNKNLTSKGDRALFWGALLKNPTGNPYDIMLKCKNPLERAAIERAMDERKRPLPLNKIAQMVVYEPLGELFTEENMDIAISILGWSLGLNPETKPLSKSLSYIHTASFAIRAIKSWNDGDHQRGLEMGIKFLVYLIWCFKDAAIDKIVKGIPKESLRNTVKTYLESHKKLKGKSIWHNLANWLLSSKVAKSVGLDAIINSIVLVGLGVIIKICEILTSGLNNVSKVYANSKAEDMLNSVGLTQDAVIRCKSELNSLRDECQKLKEQ